MGESVRQIYKDRVPKELYEGAAKELKLLKSFIGKTSVERISELEQCEVELSEVKVRLDERNKAYEDLKQQVEARIQQAVRAREVQLRLEYDNQIKTSVQNKQYNMQEKHVKPAVKAKEQAEQERDRIKEMHDAMMVEFNKQGDNFRDVLAILNKIVDILTEPGVTIEDVKQIADSIDTVTEEYLNEEEKIQLTADINSLVDSGITQKDIAIRFMREQRKGFKYVTEKTAVKKVGQYKNSKYSRGGK